MQFPASVVDVAVRADEEGRLAIGVALPDDIVQARDLFGFVARTCEQAVCRDDLVDRPDELRAAADEDHEVVRESHAERQTTLVVRANGHVYDSRWTVHDLDLEEIVLAYLGQDAARRREEVLA